LPEEGGRLVIFENRVPLLILVEDDPEGSKHCGRELVPGHLRRSEGIPDIVLEHFPRKTGDLQKASMVSVRIWLVIATSWETAEQGARCRALGSP
jgi:hypothetical protein